MRLTFKKPKGMTLIEALISTGVLAVFLGVITSMIYGFTKSTTMHDIKSNMNMDLRKAVERLESVISPARNIINSPQDLFGETFTTSAKEIVFEVPAYDINNYPIYESTGETTYDIVAIRMEDSQTQFVKRVDPTTNNIIEIPLKKLVLYQKPAVGSKAKQINGQSIFSYYIPVSSTGSYEKSSDGNITAADAPKLFSYFYLENNTVTEITDPSKYNQTRSIKVVLLSEKNYADKFVTSKRETEIRLRNSTN